MQEILHKKNRMQVLRMYESFSTEDLDAQKAGCRKDA
jgi:hypothetical protein